MDLYNTASSTIQLYINIFYGLCFSLYAGRLCGRRLRFSTVLCTLCCACVRAVLSRLLPGGAHSAPTAVRVLLLLAASALALYTFFQAPRRMGVYIAFSWTAVFELSFFTAYSAVLAADPLYDVLPAVVADPAALGAASTGLAVGSQILTAALLSVLCIVACRRIARSLRERRAGLGRAELHLVLLPAVIGILLAVLLRMILVSVSGGVPTLLFDINPPLRVLVPAIAAVALISVVHAAKTCRDMEQLEEERRAGLAAREKERALREQVAETERMNGHLRKMRHDLRNTLTVIREMSVGLPGSEELTAYLDALGQDAAQLDRPFATGDAVADILLAAKKHELASVAPDTVLDAAGLLLPSGCGVSSYDLGIVLGNALDNAVRAVAEQHGGRKFIRIASVGRGDFLSIRIENSCHKTVLAAPDGLPQRSGDTGQGIGMRSIRDVVQKNDGAMDWKAVDGVFTLAVLLRRTKEPEPHETSTELDAAAAE